MESLHRAVGTRQHQPAVRVLRQALQLLLQLLQRSLGADHAEAVGDGQLFLRQQGLGVADDEVERHGEQRQQQGQHDRQLARGIVCKLLGLTGGLDLLQQTRLQFEFALLVGLLRQQAVLQVLLHFGGLIAQDFEVGGIAQHVVVVGGRAPQRQHEEQQCKYQQHCANYPE